MPEVDGPLSLSHGDMLRVVVPVVAEGVNLLLEILGDGRDEGFVGVGEDFLGSSESEGLVVCGPWDGGDRKPFS